LTSGSRSFRSLEDFAANLHKGGVSLIDFKGLKVPTIYLDPKRYNEIMKKVLGKKVVVDTMLNIFHDGRDVFVDIQMKFLDTDLEENYLLYANDLIGFFEALSSTGLISLVPEPSYSGHTSDLFIIQLPKHEKIENALQIIRENAINEAARDLHYSDN
jgi:hypothetical protein